MKYYAVFGSEQNEELFKNDADFTAFTVNKNIIKVKTDGKGETQPADNNTASEGKANNRRV